MARESIQKKLGHVRAPRVQITYNVERDDAIELNELPLVIGVIGDFAGSAERPQYSNREFREVTFENFNELMAAVRPRASFKIPSSPEGVDVDLDIGFCSMDEFEPEALIDHVKLMRQLRLDVTREGRAQMFWYLDRILHAPEFQAVESAWRSLWYLVSRTETSPQLHIKILDASKQELTRDLQAAFEFDQSHLFKLVCERPYAQHAPEPFAVLIGNFTFGPTVDEITLLEKLAQIGSAAHAPFVAAASPEMLGLNDFEKLSWLRLPDRYYPRWQQFRHTEEASYAALTLPRVLLRPPHGIRPSVPGEFHYVEDTDVNKHLLWGSAAFALGVCITNSFTRYGWCGAIRGFEGGGLVEGLPRLIWQNEDGGNRLAVEASITDRREMELANLGFIPLVQCEGTDYAAFFTVPSCREPSKYLLVHANVNSRLWYQLPYILATSRFMHYFKAIAVERGTSASSGGVKGIAASPEDWERLLNNWISSYVLLDDEASPAIRAKFPLREARINVAEEPDRPGSYRIVAFLRPHFQLDEISVSLRLVGTV